MGWDSLETKIVDSGTPILRPKQPFWAPAGNPEHPRV